VKALLVIAIAFLCASPSQGQVESAIHGSWEWVSTTYQSGLVETPATTGHTQQVEFYADHSYRQFDDDALTRIDSWRWSYSYAHIGVIWYIDNVVFVGSDAARHWWTNSGSLHLANAPAYSSPSVVSIYSSRAPVSAASTSWGAIKALYRGPTH